APLGTALTEDQLGLLWKMADEPILCFDGDKAGQRAAFRAVDMAMPRLLPGKSLRFAMLPDGQDPDDLYRSGGREAIAEVLGGQQYGGPSRSGNFRDFSRGRDSFRGGGNSGRPNFPQPVALASTRLSGSAIMRGHRTAMPPREALILIAVINHPWLLEHHAE